MSKQTEAYKYFEKLCLRLADNQDPDKAPAMKQYMKHHFEYFGIKSPLRKTLLKEFIKENGFLEGNSLKAFIDHCFDNPHRELHYCAMEIAGRRLNKMDESFLSFFEHLVLKKSWWDSVDWIAPNAFGKLFQRFPKHQLEMTDRWNQSENIWLVRSSLLFQLKYREQTDFELLKKYILNHQDSKAFFIQKAAGWALRQYSKYNPKAVRDFITKHKDKLPKLTIKEGSKYI